MNAPTLIVGLGGKGSDVALRVSKMVTEEERQRIGFAVFDTDFNELQKIKKENPFVHTIQTSTNSSVGTSLNLDTHARDTWFPVNAILNSKKLTDGAGQVRAVSRLALESAIRAGKMEELHKAIEDLYKLEGEELEQALRVIIVSSLAGGTGSGLILPVALYIRNFLETRFQRSSNITRGFFLLPEVFYGVIPGQAERNNLKCNAYATLRELDAFLMKGDLTLPEKYKDSVKIEFPCVSSNEFEEYNIRPYDFCFLFDAQNADGKKLNSFNQYLDHAANCIYAQSIGPMNKRSNSSEDNTIRKLTEERGRNRYAGAGTSMLIYPTEDIKRYLALNWAKECVSDQWLMFDEAFRVLTAQNADMRRKGIHVQDIKEGTNYINSVESEASNNIPFAKAIIEACATYDENGVTIASYKWEDYITALGRKIEQENASSSAAELDGQRALSESSINTIEPGSGEEHWDMYVDAYKSLQTYRGLVFRHTSEVARTVAYSIFRSDGDVTKGKEKFRLETYMRTENGDFIHPCAVRYFLYKVQDTLSVEYQDVKRKVSKDEEFFDTFEDINFDDSDTSERETVNDLAKTKKVTLMDKIRRRLSADQEDLINHYREYLGTVDDYRVNAVYAQVLERGIEYVKNLSSAFETFFHSFDSKVTMLEKESHLIENKYRHLKGTAARYVCASKECLETMSSKMPYSGGVIELDSDLAEAIYLRVQSYSQLSTKSENDDYFSTIFDKDIIGYFTRKLMETYGSDVDLDIISAIEKEAEYEQGILDEERKKAYVEDVIKSAKILAAPFIEKPIGDDKQPINSCAFNDKLSPKDDSPRAHLVEEQLFDFGGEADADIPKNKIIFYKSFYGLRANELSKFAPPLKSETYERPGGEYFKAYYELVGKIHPISARSTVISPHIDKWWHNVTKMPDLDEENQEHQIDEIYAAFFWGLIRNLISLSPTENNRYEYRLSEKLFAKPRTQGITTLVVSNGTPCDQLYEVLDALAIYPELVSKILQQIQDDINKAVETGKNARDNRLMESIDHFKLRQIDEIQEESHIRSIFDLPFMMKKSMTSEIYDEEDVLRLADIAIYETKRCLRYFCSNESYSETVGEVLMEQFDRFIRNTEAESTKGQNLFRTSVFAQVCEKVSYALEEIGLDEEAREVSDRHIELTEKTWSAKKAKS